MSEAGFRMINQAYSIAAELLYAGLQIGRAHV